MVGMSGFPALSGDAMQLFKRLVVGVEQMNERLGWIEKVLWASAVDKQQETMDQGLKAQWCRMWEAREMDKELKGMDEENKVSPVEKQSS